MKPDIWMPIYIGDYLKDTQDLDGPEHGAYFLLLMYYWQKEGEIGCDIKRLSRVARSSEEVTEYVLTNYFTIVEGNYRNKRADEEMQNAENRSEQARKNAQARWEKEKCNGNADAMRAHSDGNAEEDAESMRNRCSSPSPSPSPSINSLSSAVGERFETARKTWNDAELPKYPYTALNTPPDDMRLCMPTLNAHTDEEITEAITNYQRIRDGTDYQLDPVYQSFIGFMRAGKGVDKYVSAADPYARCRVNGSKPKQQDQTMAKAKQVYDIVRRSS